MADIDIFNDNVEQYEQWFMDHPLAYVSELHAVRELLPPGNGMEVGIGTGRFAAPLAIRKGIDPSLPMAELARKKGIEVAVGIAEKLPYADQEFDFVLMVTTICFLDDLDLAFHEVHRVLKPGGAFVIGFVDSKSAVGREYEKKKNKSTFYRNAKFYSVDEMTGFLVKAGFGHFQYRQTLFKPLDQMEEVDPPKKGHGEGSFVVVRVQKE